MSRHGELARETLMDTAERLFAESGIDAVSNRRIAEAAGSANHSTVAYHFGSRDGLIQAIAARHAPAWDVRRRELLSMLGTQPSTYDLVRSGVLPLVEILDALPRPSWYARFLVQARTVPSLLPPIRERLERDYDLGADAARGVIAGVPREVLVARAAIVGNFVLGGCAESEARFAAGTQTGSWTDVGYFLIDAAAGMLAAPVTPLEARMSRVAQSHV